MLDVGSKQPYGFSFASRDQKLLALQRASAKLAEEKKEITRDKLASRASDELRYAKSSILTFIATELTQEERVELGIGIKKRRSRQRPLNPEEEVQDTNVLLTQNRSAYRSAIQSLKSCGEPVTYEKIAQLRGIPVWHVKSFFFSNQDLKGSIQVQDV